MRQRCRPVRPDGEEPPLHVRPAASARAVATLCRALVAWALLSGLVAAPALAIDGVPPTRRSLVKPGNEARVMGLLAPWQDGGPAAGGYTWVGAQIDRFRVCYRFERPDRGRAEACLVAADGVAELDVAAPRRALPDRITLALRTPTGAGVDADATALLDAAADRIGANAAAQELGTLWTHASGGEAVLPPPRPNDLLLWLPALLLWLVLATARALRGLPGGGWTWTLGLLALSAALRWTLPIEAPMTAWAWSRWTRLYSLAVESTLLQTLLDELGAVSSDTLQSTLLRVTSTFAPLAVLGHSRKLFGARLPAMAAGLLLTLSPHHLRFSAADVQFIPSMLWSSSAFLMLYETLEARRWWERALHLPAFGALLGVALTARPLNLAYAPLMLAALAMAAQQAGRAWRATLAGVIVIAGAAQAYALTRHSGPAVQGAMAFETLGGALELLFRPDFNPLLFFRLTPPVWLGLVLFGAAAMLARPRTALLRQPDETPVPPRTVQLRGVWLCLWLFGFIALHGVVVVPEPMNNARYQLHSLPAMAMLGGAGLSALWALGATRPRLRWAAAAAALLCLAAPWLHREAIADRSFVGMRERALLRSLRGELPTDCTFLEVVSGNHDVGHSHVAPVGRRERGLRRAVPWWRSVTVDGRVPATGLEERGVLARVPEELLRRPPSCLVFLEGLDCARCPGCSGLRPICREILDSGRWALLRQERFPARIYDGGAEGHLRAPGDPVQLRVWRRLHGPKEAR